MPIILEFERTFEAILDLIVILCFINTYSHIHVLYTFRYIKSNVDLCLNKI